MHAFLRVLCTVFRPPRASIAEQRMLLTAILEAYLLYNVHHSVLSVLCAELPGSGTGDAERSLLHTRLLNTLSAEDVDHPVHGVRCAVLPCFRTGDAESGLLRTPFFVSTLLRVEADHAVLGMLCTILRRLRASLSERRETFTAPGCAPFPAVDRHIVVRLLLAVLWLYFAVSSFIPLFSVL